MQFIDDMLKAGIQKKILHMSQKSSLIQKIIDDCKTYLDIFYKQFCK